MVAYVKENTKRITDLIMSLFGSGNEGASIRLRGKDRVVNLLLLEDISLKLDKIISLMENKNTNNENLSEDTVTEKDLLKKELDEKQIKYHHNASVESLKKLLEKK